MACVVTNAMFAAGVTAAPSHAYKLGGKPWPTRTITYHAATPQYDDAIASAVASWNASGARVHFKEVPRRRAKLQIVYQSRSGGPAGEAVLGFVEPGLVIPCGTRIHGPDGRPARVRCVRDRYAPRIRLKKLSAANRRGTRARMLMALIVSHELGHVLGLEHETQRCSIMGPYNGKCSEPPLPWQMRCRLLEADDVRGAIRRYGGRMRPLAKEFCDADAESSPAARSADEAVRTLVADADPEVSDPVLSWQNIALSALVVAATVSFALSRVRA